MSQKQSPFWGGVKFIGSAVALVTTSIGIFNIFIDWFGWPIAPLIEPLINLYNSYIPELFSWLNIRIDWAIPDWPPDVITVAIMQTLLMARALVAYGERDSDGLITIVQHDWRGIKTGEFQVRMNRGPVYQARQTFVQIIVVFGAICIPYIRYPISIGIGIWTIISLRKAFLTQRGFDLLSRYGFGNRRMVFAGRYIWGCILGAIVLLTINSYQ